MILVSNLNKSNYLIYFNKNGLIRKNDSFICSGALVDNLFHTTSISTLSIVENNHVLRKRKVPTTSKTYL